MLSLLNSRTIRALDRYRIYLLAAAVFAVMYEFAPNFANSDNFAIITRGSSLNMTVAIGFTIVMICGQLDLSIG